MLFKIMKSKLLPALLAIIMIVMLVPTTAFAVEPPTLVSAEVTNGGGVGLTFSKEMSPTDLVDKIKAGFTITGWDGSTKTITDASLHSASGGKNNFVQLYLDPAINGGDTPKLKYTPSDVQSLDGAILAGIMSMDITNYSPHTTLDTTTPVAVMLDSAYSHTFTASDGTEPYLFYVDEGSLPTGLTLNTNTGEVSGTPTTAGNFTFTIMVVDAVSAFDRKEFNITVNAPMAAVCEINGIEYTTLIVALEAQAP
ncbi:MAG TPA: Ig domain-containing protein [Clostridia bacterium]|nr:Ig domain-containing protein [Clostridia bacterium]